MGRLGLSEHSKCVARVRARIVAGFVARYARRCLADRVTTRLALGSAVTALHCTGSMNAPAPVIDFRAHSCHSALMDASGLKLRATPRSAKGNLLPVEVT
jgi:hypothetical protein